MNKVKALVVIGLFIAVLEGIAIMRGIDGGVLATSFTAMGGIAGYIAGKKW